MAEFRVFLSAVSSEFEPARNTLAASLRSRDMLVRVQSDFRQQAASDTTLQKLHNYIRDCSAVVCVVGKYSGSFPREAEAAPFLHILPAGVTEASYTQWEFWFARHYRRRLSIYIATDEWKAEKPPSKGDRPDLQIALIRYIETKEGLDRDYFGTVDRLCHLVLKEFWPRELPAKPIVLPYPSLGNLFKGRESFMRRLHDSLNRPDGGTAAIAGRAVHGLGGVGKTRAAVEYAWTHRDDYIALALLDSETPEKLHASLASLTAPLGLPQQEATEEAARVEAVLAWLNANPGWLLILDNIDKEAALSAANRLLGRLQGGHVIVTSRLAHFPRDIERLDLDVLTPDHAASFLLEATDNGRRKAADDAVQARTVAEELGRLALALEMAAATIQKRGLGFVDYLALWRNSRPRVVGWGSQEITGYHHAVAETWQTSVDQLTEAGRHLLERLAYLAPDPVPEFLLDVEVAGAEQEDAREALDDLVAYSLVTRDVDCGTFLVHRLVQDVTRRGLEASGTAKLHLTEALNWINGGFTGKPQDVRSWKRLEPQVPHAEAVARYADATGIVDPTGRLMNQLGGLLRSKALYAQAEPVIRRALAVSEAHLGKDSPVIAIRLNNLGLLLKEMNRLREAEPLYRRALEIDEATYGENHPEIAIDINNLAGLLRATDRLSEAEPLYRRALAIDESTYGGNHPEVATDLNNLAAVLQATGHLPEAEAMYRRALAINEASFGTDHPTVATILGNLAGTLRTTNRLSEAEPLVRRALTIDEACYGIEHPSVAIDLANLGAILFATNRVDEAEPLLRRTLRIFLALERDIRGEHPSRVTAQQNYEFLLAEMNKTKPEIEAEIATLRREAGLDPG